MAVTGILGKKIGMTQVFDEKGDVHPITVLQAGPCVITQLKTLARDGYDAAQIGFVEPRIKSKNVTKPQAGHFAKTDAPPVKVIKEVPVLAAEEGVVETKAGDRVLVDIFADAKFVDVIGSSKAVASPVLFGVTVSQAAPSHTVTCSRCRVRSAPRVFRRASSPASACPAIWELTT